MPTIDSLKFVVRTGREVHLAMASSYFTSG